MSGRGGWGAAGCPVAGHAIRAPAAARGTAGTLTAKHTVKPACASGLSLPHFAARCMRPSAVDLLLLMIRQVANLGLREQVLGAKQPGERGDAELAPALRLLAKVLLSIQQGACAALFFLKFNMLFQLFSQSTGCSSSNPGAAELSHCTCCGIASTHDFDVCPKNLFAMERGEGTLILALCLQGAVHCGAAGGAAAAAGACDALGAAGARLRAVP